MKTAPLIEKAERALTEARLLLDAGHADGAASRLYYAMRQAAAAALTARGLAVPKDHGRLIGTFSEAFVKYGPLPRELGRALNLAAELRARADYWEESVPLARVATALASAEAFIDAVRRIVAGN